MYFRRGSILDNCMCCHAETEVADQTCHFIQPQYVVTGPTSPRTEAIPPETWQGRSDVPDSKSLV